MLSSSTCRSIGKSGRPSAPRSCGFHSGKGRWLVSQCSTTTTPGRPVASMLLWLGSMKRNTASLHVPDHRPVSADGGRRPARKAAVSADGGRRPARDAVGAAAAENGAAPVGIVAELALGAPGVSAGARPVRGRIARLEEYCSERRIGSALSSHHLPLP